MNRRDSIKGALALGVGGASLLASAPGHAKHGLGARAASTRAQAVSQARRPRPLLFQPEKLKGLSALLLRSHHANNYTDAVNNQNAIRSRIAALGDDAPGFVLAALKEKELLFGGSVVLHEAYFGNLGGNGKSQGPIATALGKSFGSTDTFDTHFRALGRSLGGGSGWAVLAFDLRDGALCTYVAQDHKESLASSVPLLVLDMYEHAYHIDFGAEAARYVDAFMANVLWEEVDRRYAQAIAIHKLLH
jgi:superoxide dismutase, Fe-Mn family